MVESQQGPQGSEQRSSRLATPDQRTAAFFSLPLAEVAARLIEGEGMDIAVPDTNRKVKIVQIQDFPAVGVRRYRDITELSPGDLWNPYRQTLQSLIVTRNTEVGIGSCVRLLQAAYFDPRTNDFTDDLELEGQRFKMGRSSEGHIARYLGLHSGQRSQLKFLDDSDILYVLPKREPEKEVVNSAEADDLMRSLPEEL